jgi:proline iminopeptidase
VVKVSRAPRAGFALPNGTLRARTETSDAPGWQGAEEARISGIFGRRAHEDRRAGEVDEAAERAGPATQSSRDAAFVECRPIFTTGSLVMVTTGIGRRFPRLERSVRFDDPGKPSVERPTIVLATKEPIMKPVRCCAVVFALTLAACGTPVVEAPTQPPAATGPTLSAYFDNTGRDDVLTGGVKLLPITTPQGAFMVWTKRVGNNPKIKVLLLHGGPGATHEYFEAFDSYFPKEGFEYYYYDQLGSAFSDQPKDPNLWDTSRFVEEVEQVRQALHLDSTNFYVLGHSWGGILAMEYALKYQQNLKGMVISNMMASIPAYVDYAEKVLIPAMDQKVVAEIRELEAKKEYENPRYMELLIPNYYAFHILRMPPDQWPDPVNRAFARLNKDVYIPMQGPSEMSASGKLAKWDRTIDLGKITVPTLTIGAQHDTMDPKHMEKMATLVAKGRHLHCPNGSHMAMYDDQKVYFEGLVRFITDVDQGRFK